MEDVLAVRAEAGSNCGSIAMKTARRLAQFYKYEAGFRICFLTFLLCSEASV